MHLKLPAATSDSSLCFSACFVFTMSHVSLAFLVIHHGSDDGAESPKDLPTTTHNVLKK